jgi:hypothetical protein
MSLFGKILAILNVVAAIAFFFLAMMDYAKRQAWADLALQRAVQLEGLPVDDKEPDTDGVPRASELRDAFLARLFQDSGGDPSRTQVQEVEKVKAKLQRRLTDEQVPGTKAQKLARILLPLAPTSSERRELLQRMADAKNEKTDDLEARFDAVFQSAVSPTGPNGSPRDQAARKEAIADVLLRLAEVLREEGQPPAANEDIVTSPQYKRVLATVGLAAAAHALDGYAFHLQQVGEDIRTEMDTARYAFADLSRQKLEAIEDWAFKCDRQKDMLNAERDKAARQAEIVASRKLEVDRVLKELGEKQAATAKMLKEQAAMEKAMFESRNRARDAYEVNQKLELEIRALERSAPASQNR